MDDIKIIDENHIEVNGIAYKAVDDIKPVTCSSCVLFGITDSCLNIPCIDYERKDKRNVIFIEDNDR